MDPVSTALLAFFGSLLVGGLVGWVVGRFSAFELGLGVGLILPGAVALSFAVSCLQQYREFAAPHPNKVVGEVIEIENRPVNASGSIRQPVPVVRFTAADRSSHTVRGPGSSGLKVGEQVAVLYDLGNPDRVRVAQPSQLREAAIALMLFGTFPSSVGLWFVHSYVEGRRRGRDRRGAPDELALLEKELERPRWRTKLLEPLTIFFNLILLGGILWTGLAPGELEETLTVGFGLVSAGLWGHGIRGLFDPEASASWCFGILVLALNFSVWVVALWLLLPSDW